MLAVGGGINENDPYNALIVWNLLETGKYVITMLLAERGETKKIKSLLGASSPTWKKSENICLQGGKGATAPPIWHDYFQPTRKGGRGLSPPKYLVL